MRGVLITLPVLGALALLVSPAGAQTIEAELVLEAFDGCNCIPLAPPNCPVCHDLDGQGCNVHDGTTNNPHPGCPFDGSVPWPHPNYDYFGPQSIDQDWANIGGAREYAGDFAIKNGTEPENQASQSFVLQSGSYIKPEWPWEGAGLGYIDPVNPQDILADIYGRMHIDPIRQEYNSNHPDTPLPEPIADAPSYITIDVLRAGGGFSGGDDVILNPSIWPPDYNSVPELNATHHDEVPVPDDGEWHTCRIVDFDKYPQEIYVGLYFSFRMSGGGDGTTDENVTVWIDNLALHYTAVPPNEVCDNGYDDDGDGDIDCDDEDCYGDPACPCNPVVVFDIDEDGDVDQDDFGFFQTCITGPGPDNPLFDGLSPECKCMDVAGAGGDSDRAIDQQDYAAFEVCASGPEVMADPSCDGPPSESRE